MTQTSLALAMAAAVTLTAGAVTALGPPRPGVTVGPPVSATPASAPPPSAAVPRWLWPLAPRPRVTRPFLAPDSPWGRGHRGLDLSARPRAPVHAVAGGVVTHAARLAGRGTVTVTHPGGVRSTYEPVGPAVAVGDRVAAGDLIGHLEPTPAAHCPGGGCLHLGAIRQGYVDPLPFLVGGRVRLFPLPAREAAAGAAASVRERASRGAGPASRSPSRPGRPAPRGVHRWPSSRRRSRPRRRRPRRLRR